ncbi:MAG TPA: pyridoxal phosphate-dependent aminotransferase [Saprospiraceae bacterium]|nr:pyridoxal phosphate-dependent aminotransferase [Saprospiraceae bacterium]HRP41463.1 pyridoxal phosphate-dependent aminotransferase [Saprospiraceae bacterium]
MSIQPKKMISEKVQSMEVSATLKMAQKARDLAAQGIHVISLSLGEPDFDTPEFIKEAAYTALKKGNTKYTPVPGTMEIRKAISEKFKSENGLDYAPSQIVVSNGAKQSIANIFMAILNPGDEVLVPAPYWVSYVEIIKFSGGIPVILHSDIDSNFKVTAAQVEKAITPATKAIIFSSPCNPTGTVFTHDELKEIGDVIAQHENILVIADEIYEYINFTDYHVSIGTFENLKDRTATVNGFSKGFSMTGWRLGYMGAPQWLADACNKVQGQITSGAASFSQEAGAVALNAKRIETVEMRNAFMRRRDLIISLLKEVPGLKVNQPQGAFYVFPDVSAYFGTSNGHETINNADDFSEAMLTEAHVGTVSGSAFGNDNCIRLSYAASDDEIIEAVRRIKACLVGFLPNPQNK